MYAHSVDRRNIIEEGQRTPQRPRAKDFLSYCRSSALSYLKAVAKLVVRYFWHPTKRSYTKLF